MENFSPEPIGETRANQLDLSKYEISSPEESHMPNTKPEDTISFQFIPSSYSPSKIEQKIVIKEESSYPSKANLSPKFTDKKIIANQTSELEETKRWITEVESKYQTDNYANEADILNEYSTKETNPRATNYLVMDNPVIEHKTINEKAAFNSKDTLTNNPKQPPFEVIEQIEPNIRKISDPNITVNKSSPIKNPAYPSNEILDLENIRVQEIPTAMANKFSVNSPKIKTNSGIQQNYQRKFTQDAFDIISEITSQGGSQVKTQVPNVLDAPKNPINEFVNLTTPIFHKNLKSKYDNLIQVLQSEKESTKKLGIYFEEIQIEINDLDSEEKQIENNIRKFYNEKVLKQNKLQDIKNKHYKGSHENEILKKQFNLVKNDIRKLKLDIISQSNENPEKSLNTISDIGTFEDPSDELEIMHQRLDTLKKNYCEKLEELNNIKEETDIQLDELRETICDEINIENKKFLEKYRELNTNIKTNKHTKTENVLNRNKIQLELLDRETILARINNENESDKFQINWNYSELKRKELELENNLSEYSGNEYSIIYLLAFFILGLVIQLMFTKVYDNI